MDLADQAAAGHGRDDVVGGSPAQVLGDLESHRFRSLGVERPEVHVHEPPAEPKGDLRAKPVHLVIIALDGDDLGSVDGGAEHLALLQAVGNEHVGLQPRGGGVGRDAAGQVARSSAQPTV